MNRRGLIIVIVTVSLTAYVMHTWNRIESAKFRKALEEHNRASDKARDNYVKTVLKGIDRIDQGER